MKTVRTAMTAASILLMAASSVVTAQDKWNFEVTPYLWAAGVEGDATVQGQDVDIDVGFDDILDAVDAAGGLMAMAQRDNFVVWGQFDYVGTDTDQLDPAPAGGSIQTDSFLGALAAGYQFKGPLKDSTINLLGGIRYAWIENDYEITGGSSGKDSMDIVDGIIVVGSSFRLTEKWRFNPMFSVGAGDSDLTWELHPTFRYQFKDNMALRLGYRRLHYDIEGDTGNEFDAAFHGFIAGLSIMF